MYCCVQLSIYIIYFIIVLQTQGMIFTNNLINTPICNLPKVAVLFLSYLFHSRGNKVQISSRMLDTLSKEGLLVKNRWMYKDGSSRHVICDTIVAGTWRDWEKPKSATVRFADVQIPYISSTYLRWALTFAYDRVLDCTVLVMWLL
jgi:hypothetical protein